MKISFLFELFQLIIFQLISIVIIIKLIHLNKIKFINSNKIIINGILYLFVFIQYYTLYNATIYQLINKKNMNYKYQNE